MPQNEYFYQRQLIYQLQESYRQQLKKKQNEISNSRLLYKLDKNRILPNNYNNNISVDYTNDNLIFSNIHLNNNWIMFPNTITN
jgi:hypothetical protein